MALCKKIFCYCHIDGEIVVGSDRSLQHRGGRTVGVMVDNEMTFNEFVAKVKEKSGLDIGDPTLKFTLEFDRSELIDLVNDAGLSDLLSFSDQYAHVYVRSSAPMQNGLDVCTMKPNEDQLEVCQGLASNSTVSSNVNENDADQPVTHVMECTASTKSGFTSQSWKNEIIATGQSFQDAVAFRQALYRYSVAHRFSYTFRRNTKSYISVYCKVEGCPWHLTAYRVGETKSMRLGTFISKHSHSAEDGIGGLSHGRLISSFSLEKLKLQADMTPHEIRAYVLDELGITLNYNQAYKLKELAMRKIGGKPEESYKMIPLFCQRVMETDAHAVAKWTASPDLRFKQLFVAYGPSVDGFLNGCRPLLCIHSYHLTGLFKGALLNASAFDADNQVFPLAYGIVNSESYNNWLWFLQNLKDLTRNLKVTIISDRRQDILASIAEVYGTEFHAYSYRSIKDSFEAEVKKSICSGKKVTEYALKLLNEVVYARIGLDYDAALEKLSSYNENLGKWVVENQPEHWVLSKFPHPQWDLLTSNILESTIQCLKLENHHTVLSFITEHRAKLAKKLWDSKAAISSWIKGVGPTVQEKLMENIARSQEMQVLAYTDQSSKIGTVNGDHYVNLASEECTCAAWQMSGIPCPHAAAVIQYMRGNIYNFVAEWYGRSKQELIYANTMVPVETPDILQLDTTDSCMHDSDEVVLLPPIIKRSAGRRPRPQGEQIDSQTTKRKNILCSRCHVSGHNRRNCKTPDLNELHAA